MRKNIRSDPSNGLCLFVEYDAYFDKGFITINNDLEIIITEELNRLSPPPEGAVIKAKGDKSVSTHSKIDQSRAYQDPQYKSIQQIHYTDTPVDFRNIVHNETTDWRLLIQTTRWWVTTHTVEMTLPIHLGSISGSINELK